MCLPPDPTVHVPNEKQENTLYKEFGNLLILNMEVHIDSIEELCVQIG